MARAPIPEYARNMTWAEIRRRGPGYELSRWEFYVGLAAFVLFAAYFPWPWIADWAVVQAFVAVMGSIVPLIDGLSPEYRQLPVAASKAQLSFIHFIGGAMVICQLVTQKRWVFRDVRTWRFYSMAISAFVLSLLFVYFLFFWDGSLDSGSEELASWHDSRLEIVFLYTLMWFGLGAAWSYVLGTGREIVRRGGSDRAYFGNRK